MAPDNIWTEKTASLWIHLFFIGGGLIGEVFRGYFWLYTEELFLAGSRDCVELAIKSWLTACKVNCPVLLDYHSGPSIYLISCSNLVIFCWLIGWFFSHMEDTFSSAQVLTPACAQGLAMAVVGELYVGSGIKVACKVASVILYSLAPSVFILYCFQVHLRSL